MIVFIENILIYSRSKGDHIKNYRIVFPVIKHHQLYAMLSKCEFLLKSIAFLGHIVSYMGIAVDPRKTDVVKGCPRPLTPNDISSYLCLA